MTNSFTPRQGQYLAFIHGFIGRRGVAPSFDEIASHFGTSSPSVNGMIKTLEREGLLSRIPGVARSLRVLVPAAELPTSEFGARSSRGQPQPKVAAPTIVAGDAAVAAVIAVLDTVMPLLAPGASVAGEDAVMAAADAVRTSLFGLGLPEPASLEVAKRVLAEAARWTSDGRGAVVRRKQWRKR